MQWLVGNFRNLIVVVPAKWSRVCISSHTVTTWEVNIETGELRWRAAWDTTWSHHIASNQIKSMWMLWFKAFLLRPSLYEKCTSDDWRTVFYFFRISSFHTSLRSWWYWNIWEKVPCLNIVLTFDLYMTRLLMPICKIGILIK